MVHTRFVSFLAMLAVQASALAPNGHPNKLPKVVRRLSRILRGLGPTRGVPLAGAGETTSTADAGVADSYTESPDFKITFIPGQNIQQETGTNKTNVFRLVLEVKAEYDRGPGNNKGPVPSWQQFHVDCPSLGIRDAVHTLKSAEREVITETIRLPIPNYMDKPRDYEICRIQAHATCADLGVKSQRLICTIRPGSRGQTAERCTADPEAGPQKDGDGYLQSPAVRYVPGSYIVGKPGYTTKVSTSFDTAPGTPDVQWDKVVINPAECVYLRKHPNGDPKRKAETLQEENGVQEITRKDPSTLSEDPTKINFKAGRQHLTAKISLNTEEFDCWECKIQAFATHTKSGYKLKSEKRALSIKLKDPLGKCE